MGKRPKKEAPRPHTPEEAGKLLMETLAAVSEYWANLPDKTPIERCNGLVFSILAIFDGANVSLPAFDIVPRPDSSEKDYCQSLGQNWFEDGVAVEGASHETWYKYARGEGNNG